MHSLDWYKELTYDDIVYYKTLTTPYFLLNLEEKAVIQDIVRNKEAYKVVYYSFSGHGIAFEPCNSIDHKDVIRLNKEWVRPSSDPDYVEYDIFNEASIWTTYHPSFIKQRRIIHLYCAVNIVDFAGIQYDADKEWRGYGQIGTPKRIRFRKD